MASRDSRIEYQQRMHRVVEAIDRQIDQPWDLHRLADIAHFSPYHFHRLFLAWMGETLGDYLRRRRLELAAVRLLSQPRTPVLDVALTVGFGSGEAFARAFKLRFGASPSAWRQQQIRRRLQEGNPDQVLRKFDQANAASTADHRSPRQTQRSIRMDVRLIEWPPTRLACLRHQGAYGEPVSLFWQQQAYPWLAREGLLGQPRYGISHDDPGITAPAQCRYDACAALPPNVQASAPAFASTLSGGRYAVMPFKGRAEQVGTAWTALLRDWLPSSGLQLDARPCFEHYPVGSSFDPISGVFDCEICIPVTPL